MNTFTKTSTEMGYKPLEEEKERLALMVCAAKRLIDARQKLEHPLAPDEQRMVEGVGYDIYYTAKHFMLPQKKFESEIGQLAQQFLEDGTYDRANEKFKQENADKITQMKKEVKRQRKIEKNFIGDGSYSSNVKH